MKLFQFGMLVAGAEFIAGGVAQSIAADGKTTAIRASAPMRDCPSGSVLASYASGSRVYAVARTESSDCVRIPAPFIDQ